MNANTSDTTMHMLSEQEIFTKVATHLLKQMKRAVNSSGAMFCCFKASDGSTCAIGHIIEPVIPDLEKALIEHNSQCMAYDVEPVDVNIHSFKFLTANYPAIMAKVGLNTADNWSFMHSRQGTLLSALREVHDESAPEHWNTLLKILARDRGLEMPVVLA